MSGFLYYMPKASRHNVREKIVTHKVDYAVGDSPIPREVSPGPDGGSGVVVAPNSYGPTNAIGYYPKHQSWRHFKPTDVWVGHYSDGGGKGTCVSPDDLKKKTVIPGHVVTLGDGKDWMIPLARGMSDDGGDVHYYNALPTVTDIDDEGNWCDGKVDGRYSHLDGIAARWWDTLSSGIAEVDGDEQTFDFDGERDAFVSVLSVNYHISKIEVAMLGLANRHTIGALLCALIDWDAFIGILKKKEELSDSDQDG